MWMYPEIQKQQVECRQTLQNRMNFNSLPCVVVVCWGGFSCTIFFNCFNCSGRHMTPGTFGNETLQKTASGLKVVDFLYCYDVLAQQINILFCLLPGSSLQRTDNYRDLKMCALCLLQLL